MTQGIVIIGIKLKHPRLAWLNKLIFDLISELEIPRLTQLASRINVWFFTRWCVAETVNYTSGLPEKGQK